MRYNSNVSSRFNKNTGRSQSNSPQLLVDFLLFLEIFIYVSVYILFISFQHCSSHCILSHGGLVLHHI